MGLAGQVRTEYPVNIFVVLLHSTRFHSPIQRRYEATAKLLNKADISHELVEAEGANALAQVMGLVLFGDYVSFYLAMLNKTDPMPVASIDFIKQYLASSKNTND